MARKMRHSKKHASRKVSRKASRKVSRKLSRKLSRRHRRTRRGGAAHASYDLANTLSAKQSLMQGADFLQYHKAQHGGVAPYPGGVVGTVLPADMAGPAMTYGINRAIADVAGLRDPPFDAMPVAQAQQKVGGRRRKGRKSRKVRRGGMAPVGAPAMLLSGAQYSQAGLNPDYRGAATEYAMAAVRDRA
jgi:hypothetical protein